MYDFSSVKKYSDAPYQFTELQEKCIRDLETTEAPQAQNMLEVHNKGFCCLGRWCVIAGAARIVHEISDDFRNAKKTLINYEFGGQSNTYVLPDKLANLLKVMPSGEFKNSLKTKDGYFSSLVGMNDSGFFSFKDIAAYIRYDPWNIFTDRLPAQEVKS